MLPEPFAAALFLQDCLEERKGQLLNLVDQKSQHHQQSKVNRQILLAVSVVMFKVVTLILEGIEGFIFDFPTGTSTPHQVKNVDFGYRQIGNPAKVLDFVSLDFPIFNEVDQHILIGGIQGNLVDETKTMGHTLTGYFIFCCLSSLMSPFHLLKQKNVVFWFNPQNETQIVLF